MDPDRSRQLDVLLQSALPLSPAHREVFLQKLRANDPGIPLLEQARTEYARLP
jgi:hypothetical protein